MLNRYEVTATLIVCCKVIVQVSMAPSTHSAKRMRPLSNGMVDCGVDKITLTIGKHNRMGRVQYVLYLHLDLSSVNNNLPPQHIKYSCWR